MESSSAELTPEEEAVVTACLEVLRQAPSAVITDIDGTISDIAPTPAEAMVDPGARAALARLVERLAAVAVVSGRAPQDGEPIAPRGVAPVRVRRPGGDDRIAHVLAGADREASDDEVAIDGGSVLEGLVAQPFLSADEHRVGAAEIDTGTLERGVEGRLELLVVGRERGVGDLHAWRGGHRCGGPHGCGVRGPSIIAPTVRGAGAVGRGRGRK